jgi:multimeric flavodoxin WrbA
MVPQPPIYHRHLRHLWQLLSPSLLEAAVAAAAEAEAEAEVLQVRAISSAPHTPAQRTAKASTRAPPTQVLHDTYKLMNYDYSILCATL